MKPGQAGVLDPVSTSAGARLLVSVRSANEALAALAGGAAIIDVKEPLQGPLGRAPLAVWREVREVVRPGTPVSVALGELTEWLEANPGAIPPATGRGLDYCKLGLSNAPRDWIGRWREVRHRLAESAAFTPAWVAVVYIDWPAARAPEPAAIIQAAGTIDSCRGVLFDTWDKSRRSGIDLTWKPLVDQVRDSGRFVALAGSLDVAGIERLRALRPDIVAVRGAACAGGDRLGPIDPDRVTALARAAGSLSFPSHDFEHPRD
jgi:uncharacterized protein (UPF0264 family)